jgi:hypothetical protein
MKKILSIVFSLALVLGISSSCAKWLDVNVDPDSPSNGSATCENRLPWIQYYFMYAYGTANTRTSCICQMVTGTSRTATSTANWCNWNPAQGTSTTIYQNWFLGAACNIPDLLTKAEAEGAYHYMGAALAIKAMGYILMVDLYGEMPYTDAVGANYAPEYDNGDVIYHGCLADIDEAIKYLGMAQEPGAANLAAGDCWCGGDTQAWIRLCYGMKARWLNNLSKTSEYNPEEILACVAKGPGSNDQNITMKHYNVETAGTCFTVGDAYGPNTTWDSMAWGTGQRLAKYYVNLLTNFKGTGVEDPRADKLLPWTMYKATLTDAGVVSSYEWLRDEGLDSQNEDDIMFANRVVNGNLNAYLTLAMSDVTKNYSKTDILKYYKSVDDFVKAVNKYYSPENVTINVGSDGVALTYHRGAMYVNDQNPLYIEDIKYVQLRADAVFETSGLSATDMCCYYSAASANTRAAGFVQGTGSFYARPTSDSYIMTYPEMCFIKAEVLMKKGDNNGAYTAYIDGIKGHFDLMNRKLTEWKGQGCGTTARGFDISFCIDPMSQNDINAYMKSAAVKQSASALTMSDIMMQKYIAMGPDVQKYNDMRKHNFYRDGIYTEMKDPAYRTATGFSANPKDQSHYPRRWMHSTHETNYNASHVNAIYEQYAGQYNFSTEKKALAPEVWSIPVWWDKE